MPQVIINITILKNSYEMTQKEIAVHTEHDDWLALKIITRRLGDGVQDIVNQMIDKYMTTTRRHNDD